MLQESTERHEEIIYPQFRGFRRLEINIFEKEFFCKETEEKK